MVSTKSSLERYSSAVYSEKFLKSRILNLTSEPLQVYVAKKWSGERMEAELHGAILAFPQSADLGGEYQFIEDLAARTNDEMEKTRKLVQALMKGFEQPYIAAKWNIRQIACVGIFSAFSNIPGLRIMQYARNTGQYFNAALVDPQSENIFSASIMVYANSLTGFGWMPQDPRNYNLETDINVHSFLTHQVLGKTSFPFAIQLETNNPR